MKILAQTGPLCAVLLLFLVAATASSTYEEDLVIATVLTECEWNTYMCCWTGNDGPSGMTPNTDVCRVLDYPEEGDVLEMSRDDEGPVYCHGFGWENDADPRTHILPLYQYVKNFDRTEEGGYYGSVEGSPECGCIEDMPVVSDAACSRYSNDGIGSCGSSNLRTHYRSRLDQPRGEMENNLVKACDNQEVPEFDFSSCSHNAWMCCWTEIDGPKAFNDNTDVCRLDNYPERGQTTEYPGDSEGDVHCHGFVWPEDAADRYIHLLGQRVETFDHVGNRGYYGNVEGAPSCGCVEDMPIVSKAQCTTYQDEEFGMSNVNSRLQLFAQCTNNDLRVAYEEKYPTGELDNLVGQCDNEDM